MGSGYSPEREVLLKLTPEDVVMVKAVLDNKTLVEIAQTMWPEVYGANLDDVQKNKARNRADSRKRTKKIRNAVEKIRAIRLREKGMDAVDTVPFTEAMVTDTHQAAMRILDKPIDVRSKYKELADPMLREKVILFYKTDNEKLKKEIICDIQDRAGYKPVEKIEHSAMDGKSVPELMNVIINNFFGVKNLGKVEGVTDCDRTKGIVEGEVIAEKTV